MNPNQLQYTKNQLAEKLEVLIYILDLWTKQFEIQPNDELLYTQQDLDKLRSVKMLLYEKGLSIDAAKKYLQDDPHLQNSSFIAASLFESKNHQSPPEKVSRPSSSNELIKKLDLIKQELLKISNNL